MVKIERTFPAPPSLAIEAQKKYGRYSVPQENRRYVMAFYIHGIMAIITEWLKEDCQASIEYITELIQNCVTASH